MRNSQHNLDHPRKVAKQAIAVVAIHTVYAVLIVPNVVPIASADRTIGNTAPLAALAVALANAQADGFPVSRVA